ncbi:MAG: hypothetical protein AB7Q29_04335 [Vicinamibacterales bacterium]
MRVNVISLFRDSEPYLRRTFGNIEALERRHDIACFFYENDSVDRTPELLRRWMEGRAGTVICETLGARKFGQTMEPERVQAMARYRNTILAEAVRVASDWTLLLDSDVDFPPDLIEQYLQVDEPGVAMFTPWIELDRACQMCEPPCHRPAYYDTFALRDRSDRRGVILSCNPFWDRDDRHAWARGRPVEVHCAFGGAALIRSGVLGRCRWHSDGDCEHVAFAEQVRAIGRILAVPTVKASTHAGDGFTRPETFAMQRQLLDSPLLLRFWTERNRGRLPFDAAQPS